MKHTTHQPRRSSLRRHQVRAEWITFIIACLIVTTLIGLVLFTWITQDDQPPVLSIRIDSIRQAQGQYYVPFTITNEGGGTAESVQVIGELKVNGQVETGEQQIDFLSGGEKQEGAFIFRLNPRQGQLSLRAASYKLP